MKHLAVSTFAMALAGAASAQTPASAPAPTPAQNPVQASAPQPTAEQTAALNAMADGLIAKTGHPELFENVSKGDFARVRHKESGAVCTFSADEEGAAIELTARKADPGFDIYCHGIHKGLLLTALTVTRLHDKIPLDRLFRAASQAFRTDQSRVGKVRDAGGAFSDKDPIPGVIMADLPPSMTVRLSVTVGAAGELFSRREVIEIGDWAVFDDFVVPRIPQLADPLGRLQAMGDFKAIADAQKAGP